MAEVQGQGYIAQALGIADVLAVAYFHALTYRPDDPEWDGRDRFLLSNGHYAIALYAALIEAGILPEAEIETYGSDGSRLPMSGMAAYTPGMEMSGGSLGLGLSIAVGMALGLKRKASQSRVFNLFSDGELDEGSTWEAIMSAAHWRLDNLIGIVDVNNQQADGPSTQVTVRSSRSSTSRRLRLVLPTGGRQRHRRGARRLRRGEDAAGPKPRMIVCDTSMGQGRAVPGGTRTKPLPAGRRARMAAGARRARRRAGRHERRHPRADRRTKPRLTTSAMIASIAADGSAHQARPLRARAGGGRRDRAPRSWA